MPVIDKPLEDIEISDLQELIELGVQEGKEIEYKKFMDISTDANDHKETFVGEVTSFANTQGGDLIVGLPDDDGTPQKVAGFPLTDGIDTTLERWSNVIRRQTDPTLPTAAYDIEAIPTENDRAVVIVRVERSWRSPHRVALNDRFYGRSPSGKVRLDAGELRRRFRESEQRQEQVQEFRAERVAEIQAGETPVPIQDGPVVSLHVVPFSSFDFETEIDVSQATVLHKGAPRLFGPKPQGSTERYTIDGLVTCMNEPTQEQPAYTLTFRSGAIEAVAVDMFHPPSSSYDYPYLDSSRLRTSLEATLPRFCRFLLRQDVYPPFAVFLTVIGASEYTVQQRQGSGGRYLFDREVAQLPVEVIEQVPNPNPEPLTFSSEPGVHPSADEPYDTLIDNLMDSLWQAIGQSGEPRD